MYKEIEGFQLQNINFKLEPGYIMGLIGPNGAGKSTLILTLLGLYRKREGTIKICGYDLATQERKAKEKIGFVLDDSPFLETLSATENAKLYGAYYPTWEQHTFEAYCRHFEVNTNKPLKKLSKGNKMKFQLAFALSHGAKVLVLDEPAAGLDPAFRKELIEIMCETIAEGDKSILFSTHLTDELDKIADYITFLYKGKQIFSLSKEEMCEEYALAKGSANQINRLEEGIILGKRIGENGSEALVKKSIVPLPAELLLQRPTIEDIMFYMVNGTI